MPKILEGQMNAPAAVGPYSRAVASGNLVFLSGQVGLDPATGKLVEGGFEAQAQQVLKNISGVLDFLKLTPAAIVKTTIFVTDLANFAVLNKLYGEWVGDHKPARSTVQVAGLPLGAVVEIELVVERA